MFTAPPVNPWNIEILIVSPAAQLIIVVAFIVGFRVFALSSLKYCAVPNALEFLSICIETSLPTGADANPNIICPYTSYIPALGTVKVPVVLFQADGSVLTFGVSQFTIAVGVTKGIDCTVDLFAEKYTVVLPSKNDAVVAKDELMANEDDTALEEDTANEAVVAKLALVANEADTACEEDRANEADTACEADTANEAVVVNEADIALEEDIADEAVVAKLADITCEAVTANDAVPWKAEAVIGPLDCHPLFVKLYRKDPLFETEAVSTAKYPAFGRAEPDPNTVMVFWSTNTLEAVTVTNEAVPSTFKFPNIPNEPVRATD